MRYIIIPLVIVLYIIWTVKSVKNLAKYGLWYCDDYALFWFVFHLLLLLASIVTLSILYW
jgi:hypothetical protein